MSRYRHMAGDYTGAGGKTNHGVIIEICTSDRQIRTQDIDKIMLGIDKRVRYVLNSRKLYLQAEQALKGDES